jgi:hypothetical protein
VESTLQYKLQECGVAESNGQKRSPIGNFLGQPVYATITSRNMTYVFDRIARYIDGEFPLDQLDKEEVLIRPGLIYRPAR